AWQAIDILSNLAGTALVEKVVGGAGGGGARLTQAGQELLKASTDLERAKTQLVKKASAKPRQDTQTPFLGLRTTMRNQFPCSVTAITKKAGFVRVALTAKGGTVFHSKITTASAELFELHVGQPVLVLCKATAVQINKMSREKDKNVIHGMVVRKSRGSASGEVNLLVEPGITIVGFVEQLSQFNIRDEAKAVIDETAVVLALDS
ncbi:MAG: ModE family transcriptional regulator, partial [Betaproteobacteria bacterium]|nr:ModE family transcriptional regulator [Betaproteobacteria bacterium]